MFNKPTNKEIPKNSQQQIYIGKKKNNKQYKHYILYYLDNII